MGAPNGRQPRGDGASSARAGVRYSVLTPNLKGFEAAVLDKPDEIVVVWLGQRGFQPENINRSIAESIERFAPVVEAALARPVLRCAGHELHRGLPL